MQFSRMLLVAALAGPGAAPALAAGPQLVEITVTNTGGTALACGAAIAHWFSEDLGRIAPGGTLGFSFGYDLETGTPFRLNEVGDRMAVQRVWCGIEGEDWVTRAEIGIDRRAGVLPAPAVLNCAAEGRETRCAAP